MLLSISSCGANNGIPGSPRISRAISTAAVRPTGHQRCQLPESEADVLDHPLTHWNAMARIPTAEQNMANVKFELR